MIARRRLLRAGVAAAVAPWFPYRAAAALPPAPLPPTTTLIERIAFGSCADQRLPQPFWDAILDTDPQLLLLLGDNVYGDVSSAEMTELREAYTRLASEPGFQRVRARVPIIAIWDDHDYGANDAGGDFPHRAAAAALFRAFWGIPADSPRGQGDGLYEAFRFGPAGRRLQIIVLDVRSFRSPLRPSDERGTPGKERYLPDPDPAKTMLGETQWQWLAACLKEPAELRLIVSSIQVLAESHGWERWGNLPLERDRLLRLIAETRARGVVFLSGDRHLGAAYRLSTGVPYLLTEITSSSLNRPFPNARETDLRQIGPIIAAANFGTIRIDWPMGRVHLQLRGDDGKALQAHELRLADLRP